MHILILGGTAFLGRALAEAALARGHRLTLFNRGQSNPDLFPEAEKLRGDRTTDLSALRGKQWDVVIDTCGYVPRVVRQSAELLADSAAHYTFISTLSVYSDLSQAGIDERAPVGVLADETVEEVTGETYGPLKALCEQEVERALPGRALIIRPGLIVGPHDPTDRFTYWPHRVAEGGEVLAPGRPERGVQFIDVRDLAEWTLRMAEAKREGVFNADSAPGAATMGELLHQCRTVSGGDAQVTWVGEQFLLQQKVAPWGEMPVWIPESDPMSGGFFSISVQRAVEAGLALRPLGETVRATLDWDKARPEHAWRAGLTREREAQLLNLWKAQPG